MLLDRGRLQRSLGEQREGAERQKLMEAARGYLTQSDAVWSAIDSAADEDLKNIVFERGEDIKRSLAREGRPPPPGAGPAGPGMGSVRNGPDFAPHSAEGEKALLDAGKQFDTIYDQQRERLAGYYARLGRGSCYRELGDVEKAFSVFEELFSRLSDAPADFHALRGKSAEQALEISLRPDVKKYKEGLDIAKRWVAGETPGAAGALAQRVDEIDLAIEFLGGEAARGYLNSLPPPSAEQSAIRGRLIDWMRRQYEAVAAAAGPYQARAKVRLLDSALGRTAAKDAEKSSDALTRARLPWTAWRPSRRNRRRPGSRASTIRMPIVSGDSRLPPPAARRWTAAVKHWKALRQSPAESAIRRTITWRISTTMPASLRKRPRRARQCFNPPKNYQPRGKPCGSAWLRARRCTAPPAAPEDRAGNARSAAVVRLRTMAEAIVRRWGSYPEADDARAVLTDLALADRQLDKAEDNLRQISQRSPRRGKAELGVGEAEWAPHNISCGFRRSSTITQPRPNSSQPARRTCLAMASPDAAAIEVVRAIHRPRCPAQILSLAQIDMFRGRASEAVDLLESDGKALAGDACLLQLLAYVATEKLDKARGSLQAMYQTHLKQDSGDSGRQIVQTCVHFGRLTARHLARYRDHRMDNVLKQTVGQLDAFLAAPAEGPAADSLFVNVFRAEALAGLATGLDSGGPAVPGDAQVRFRKAIAAFDVALQRAAAERNLGPPADLIAALRIDLARCLRRMSDYAGSLNQLVAVLKEHPRMIDAQLEAAYTYQSWGDERPEYLEMAIQGSDQHREVWGFGELARRVQPEARFREVFFEARYNLALCRFRQAQMAGQRQDRSRLAEAAEEDILATRRIDGDLGGPLWYDRYNELFRRRSAPGRQTGRWTAQSVV